VDVLGAQFLVAGVLTALVTRGTHSALQDLTRARHQLADWLENAPDGLLVIGGNGRVIGSNPRSEEFFATRVEDRTVWELGILSAGAPQSDLLATEEVLLPTGRTLSLSVRENPASMEHQWLVNLRDITERVENERRAAALQTELDRARKLETIGRLSGGIAHDFNNLLTVILSNAHLAQTDPTVGSSGKELMNQIQQAGESAARMTDQLLAMSTDARRRARVVDLAQIVEHHMAVLQGVVGDHIVVHLDMHPVRARIDVAQVEQILQNLVTNAQDSMPRGGELSVSVGPADRAESDEPWARLSVRDTGQGIAEASLPQLFDPFFSTKSAGRGTGLGLATVEMHVTRSGGHIEVETKADVGTTFHVYLRATKDPLGGSGEQSEQGAVPVQARILLVDDEANVRRVAAVSLEREGFVVHTCSGLLEVRQALASGLEFDLLLTDVVLEGHSGPEVAEVVQHARPGTPVVFMSGFTAGILRKSNVDGDSPLVRKPFTPAQLREAVTAALTARQASPPHEA